MSGVQEDYNCIPRESWPAKHFTALYLTLFVVVSAVVAAFKPGILPWEWSVFVALLTLTIVLLSRFPEMPPNANYEPRGADSASC